MYRALTDDPPLKKNGFIVDLNMKRIIKAMFEYDLEKDKLRVNVKTPMSIADRLQKQMDLCDWGQEAYIEDNPDKSFNDIMNDIKTRVLDDLANKIYLEFEESGKKRKGKQDSLIIDNNELFTSIIETLIFTQSKKGAKPKAITMARRGEHIPSAPENPKTNANPGENKEGNAEEGATQLTKKPQLTNEQILEKIDNILKTFINSLVIKSTEGWNDINGLNLAYLLNKYNTDKNKITGIPSCDCSSNTNCKIPHNNLYETAYCELKSYAITLGGTNTKPEYIYNEETHRNIMKVVEQILENPSILNDWNIYIQSLLKTLKESKPIIQSNTTRKKKRGL